MDSEGFAQLMEGIPQKMDPEDFARLKTPAILAANLRELLQDVIEGVVGEQHPDHPIPEHVIARLYDNAGILDAIKHGTLKSGTSRLVDNLLFVIENISPEAYSDECYNLTQLVQLMSHHGLSIDNYRLAQTKSASRSYK